MLLQNEMVLRKMGPHPEDHIPKTDLQIIDEVLQELTSSSQSSIAIPKGSSKTSSSSAYIRELEDRLATQEQQYLEACERYDHEIKQRMQDQEQKFEDLRMKQELEIATLKKDQEEKSLEFAKRQQEMDALLSFLLRTKGNA